MDSSEDEDSKKLVIVTSESDEENSNEPNAKRRKLLKRLNVTTHKCLSPQPAKDVSKTSCLVGVQDGCSAQSLDEQSVEHHQQRTLLYNRGTQSPLLVFVSLVEKKQGETTHRQSSAAEGKHGTLKMKFTKNRLSQPGVAGGNEPAWELEPRSIATIVAKPACAQANVAETASFEDCLPHCIDGPSPILALPSTSTSGPAIPSELCGSLYQPKVVKSRQPKPHSNVKQPDASLYHSTGVCLPNKASYVQPAEECANVEQNPVDSQTFATICSSVLSSLAAKCPASSNQSSALDSHTNKSLFDLLLKLLEVGLHLNSSDVDTSAVNLENVLKAYYERLEPRASFIKINEQKYGYLLDLLKLGLDLSQSSILYGWTKFISMVKVRSNGNKPCAEAVVDVQMGYLLKELQAALQRKPKKNMTNTILFNTLLTMLELGLQLGALSYQTNAASLDKVLKEYQAELNPKPTLLKGKVVKLCLLKDNVEEVQHYLPSDEIVVMRMAKFEHWLELLKLGIWLAAAKECALLVELDELLCKYKSDYTEREENLTKVNLGPLLTLLKKQLLPSAITRQKNDVNLYEVVEATPSEVIAELGQSLVTVQTSSNYQKSAASVDLPSGDSSIIEVGTETQTVQVVEQADQDKGKPEPSGTSAERFSFSDSNQPSTSDYRSTAATRSKPETAGSSDDRITSDKFAMLLELIEVWLKLNGVNYFPVNLCEMLSERKKDLTKKTKPVKMTTDQYDRLLGVLDTGLLLSDASFSKLKQADYVQEVISKPHQTQGGKQFRLVNLALLLEDLETGLISRDHLESSERKYKCLNKCLKTELLRICNVTGTNKGRITCYVVVDNNEEFASRKLPTYGNSVPNWLYLLEVGVHLTSNFEMKTKLVAWLQQCKIMMRSTEEKKPMINLSYVINDIAFEEEKPATSLEKGATKVEQRIDATRKSASQCAAVDADLLNKFSKMVIEQRGNITSGVQISSSNQLTKTGLQTRIVTLVQPCTTQCNPVNCHQKITAKNPTKNSAVQPQENAVPTTSSKKVGLNIESTASYETNAVKGSSGKVIILHDVRNKQLLHTTK